MLFSVLPKLQYALFKKICLQGACTQGVNKAGFPFPPLLHNCPSPTLMKKGRSPTYPESHYGVLP